MKTINLALLTLQGIKKRHTQNGITFELIVPQLDLEPGSFAAIVGESGCGKSTLLDVLALISRPFSCEQFIYSDIDSNFVDIKTLWDKGQDSALAKLRRQTFGYVLQTGGLLPFLTVAQNLTLPARLNGRSTKQLNALAERIGIRDVLHKKPQYLSGGQRQRAAVLRALLHHPRVVLADEPTGAVDRPRAETIVQDLADLAKENQCAVVMVTHDRELVRPFVDKTYTFELEAISETYTQSTLIQEMPVLCLPSSDSLADETI